MVKISVSFGGDSAPANVTQVSELAAAGSPVAAVLGYDPARVEFVRNGEVLCASALLGEGDVVSVRTKANTKGAVKVYVNFGGDSSPAHVTSVTELSAAGSPVAAVLGYDPLRVEFVRDGQVLTASDELDENDDIVVRTKANTKGC